MKTTKTLEQAITDCAAHWANVWDTTPEWIIQKARSNYNWTVMPEHGWSHSRFSDWGTAQKVSRGIKALGKAIDGNPSRQWMAIWMR